MPRSLPDVLSVLKLESCRFLRWILHMRKSKFSESQIVGILKDAESGVPVADLLRKHGVSKATFFKWRSRYGGASVSDVKRLRELEAENAKLKRMYADLALENAAIKDVLNRKL